MCVVIMLAVPYFADRASWAIAYCQAFEENGLKLPFGDAFGYLYELLEYEELMGEYIKNLLLVYGFTALGSFAILRGVFTKKAEIVEETPVEELTEEAPAEEAAPVEE